MSLVSGITSYLGNSLGLNTGLDKKLPEEGFDIDRFLSESISNTGVMKNNLFIVRFTFPMGGNMTKLIKNSNMLTLYCEATALPGVVLEVDEDIRRYGIGTAERRPIKASFPGLDLSFISDGRGNILKFFQSWMSTIINFDSSKGMSGRSKLTGALPYEVAYRDDYICDIEVVLFDEAANKIIQTKLLSAFPRILGDVGLAWSITNDFARVPVRFEYKDWNTNFYDPAHIEDSSVGGLDFIQKLILAGTMYQTISTMHKPRSIGDILNVTQNASNMFETLPKLF